MKKLHSNIQPVAMLLVICTLLFSCQKMDRPELGDYPRDANAAGGPLKFYAAFDGTTANPLFNAVDSIKANFAAANPLTSITGVSGKGVQGAAGKAIKYNAPNDWGNNLSSFSISLWLKGGIPPDDEFATLFSLAHNDLYYKQAIHFDLYPGNWGSTTSASNSYFYVEQPNGDYIDFEVNGLPNLMNGNWHHLVITYDETNSSFKFYVDGALFFTRVWTGHGPFVVDPSKIFGLAVGGSNRQAGLDASNDSWMYSWQGGLDQLRLYGKKVLTQAEITALFQSKL
jgi:hypothetical protein